MRIANHKKRFSMGTRHSRPRHSTAWVFLATLCILPLVSFTVWLANGHLAREVYCSIQRDWFISLNLALNTWPAEIWSNLTLLGDATVLIPLLSVIIIWRPQAWAATLAAAPVASLLSVTMKKIAAVPRPAAFLDQDQFTLIGHALKGSNSFPSGHSLTIFTGVVAVLVILLPQSRNRRYWLMLIAACLVAVTVALSRVAVGAHWPLDVLGGALCGLIAGFAGAALTQRYQKWWRLAPDSFSRCIVGGVVMLLSLSLIDRALDNPLVEIVLWLSALCGMSASIWLMRACLNRLRSNKARGNSAYSHE